MNGREKMNYPDFTYREGPKNDSKSAMLMNHFCSTFKLPDMIESEMVNNEYVIMHNARMFAKQRDFGSFPNIIAVDLYDKGDIWPAQDLIRNGNKYVGDEWEDGTLCGAGTTCWRCRDKYSFWSSKAMTACGLEPCWADGSVCASGSTCNNCCNSSEFWYSKAITSCGSEPCWGTGTTCGRGTFCNACCDDDDDIYCPWYGFGLGCSCG